VTDQFVEVNILALGVNESTGTFSEWLIDKGQKVSQGDLIAVIETTKVAIEVEAPQDGFLVTLCKADQEVSAGQTIGLIVKDQGALAESQDKYLSMQENTDELSYMATRKAERLAKKYNIDLNILDQTISGIIRESDVENYHSKQKVNENQNLDRNPVVRGHNGRVLIIGGGKGATQLLSILLHEVATEVIGILDDTEVKQGSIIGGIPVLGYTSDIDIIVAQYEIESVICSVSTSISFREKVYEDVKRLGSRLANAIHQTVVIDDDVTIGEGNFIGANCYLGNSVSIGNYCFISSGCIFEHHNLLGDGIATGPNVVTSGCVTIGNHVRFGTGIYLEPNLQIGRNAIISSGTCVLDNISDNSVLRKEYNQTLKSL